MFESLMTGQPPRLSFSQLFSFQVAHNLVASQQAGERYHVNLQAFKDLLKKGQWNRSILEVDFTNAMIFLQDKDKIIAAQPFADFKKFVVSGDDFEDNLISLRFTGQQWQIMAQNSAEKACLLHLLQCVAKDTSAEEALAAAGPGILGLNKSVLRAGILIRKAKTQFKRDERYCVLVPGKLFMFKNRNLPGQHVRYVTSLMGASVRMLQGLEFELLVPGTKTLTFVPDNVEEVTGWMGTLERSVEIAQQLLAGGTYEQQDQVPNNVFASMNPMAGMMPGQSGGGGFIQTATHNLGAYTNPQDSRAIQQRIMGGLGGGGGMYQQAQLNKPFSGATTHLSLSSPFGVNSPYAGNFQANIAQGNGQNPMDSGNVQRSGGMFQQGGLSTSVFGQAGFMGQGSAGPNTSYTPPQGNFNTPNQFNSPMSGTNQGPQKGWGQGQQNQNVLPGETGVKMIRRATQTLRDFNNNMDRFLAQPSTSGYSGAAPPTQNPGLVGGAPQAQLQGYGGARQAQVPMYGVSTPQTQVPGYGSGAPQTQVPGYGRGAPQTQVPRYGRRAPQTQVQGYGSPQTQVQGYGGPQQGQVSGYGRGGVQEQVQGASQAQVQTYASAQQSQFHGYGGGSPQAQAQGYGRGAPQAQAQGYGRGAYQVQMQGYGGAQPGQIQGAPQGQMQTYGVAQQGQVQQAPAYGGGAPQMQAPNYGRGAPQTKNLGYALGAPPMQNPQYGREIPIMPQPQYRAPASAMTPTANLGDWKEFTSPDGRT